MRISFDHRRFFYISPRTRQTLTSAFFLILLLVFPVMAGYLFLVQIHPAYVAHVQIYARNLATQTVNQSLLHLQEQDAFSYGNFVRLSFRNGGIVSAIETDSARMNRFKTLLLSELANRAENLPAGELRIPLGNLLSQEVFSGIGPRIPVKVRPGAVARADFSEEFTTVGINQVKHRIYLNVSMSVYIISALGQRSETVSATVPVAESIIVGEVPNYYAAGSIVPAVDAESSAQSVPTDSGS